jgi:hypothetical protein
MEACSSSGCKGLPLISRYLVQRVYSTNRQRGSLVPGSQDSKSLAGQPQGEQWTEVLHRDSGQIYYWNEKTGATPCSHELVYGTKTGIVAAKQGNTLVFGNGSPGETTALGEPKPQGLHRQPEVQQRPSLVGLMAAGAGIGLMFGIMRHIF